MSSGMLVCSGDVLLLFNPLQLDFYAKGAMALSMKENVNIGKNHGVFFRDNNGNVGKFLHKQSPDDLAAAGAVDHSGKVNIDTGAVILSSDILEDLYHIVDTDEKFRKYVNDTHSWVWSDFFDRLFDLSDFLFCIHNLLSISNISLYFRKCL